MSPSVLSAKDKARQLVVSLGGYPAAFRHVGNKIMETRQSRVLQQNRPYWVAVRMELRVLQAIKTGEAPNETT